MRVATFKSPATRRLVVQPIEGASIRETLLELCATEAVDRIEIHASGRIDHVRLRSGGSTRPGAIDVITLTGSASAGDVQLALLGVDERGSLIGGLLLDARAVELSMSVELLRVDSPGRAADPPARTGLKSASWAEVAAVSARALPVELDSDEPAVDPPRPGDSIEHASFGRCVVEKLEDDEDFVVVRSAQGRLLRLSLEVLRPELLGEHDGKRDFRSRPRGARSR